MIQSSTGRDIAMAKSVTSGPYQRVVTVQHVQVLAAVMYQHGHSGLHVRDLVESASSKDIEHAQRSTVPSHYQSM